MPAQVLKVSARVRALIRQLHPNLKRKVRSALTDILEDPACGKPLKKELKGYRSLQIGWHRIIYRPIRGVTEIVATGPRRSIYEETAYQILRGRARD